MSKYVTPRFDFSGPIALDGDGQAHTAERTTNNNLAPVKFNEYERVMVSLAEVIADYELSDTVPGAPDTIGGSIRRLYEVMIVNLALKVDKAGDDMTGPLIITGTGLMLDVTGNLKITGTSVITGDTDIGGTLDVIGSIDTQGDLDVDGYGDIGTTLTVGSSIDAGGYLNISGNYTSTDRDVTTPGRVDTRAVKIEWASGRLYRIGDLVVQDKKIYRCRQQHTSTTFIDDYAANWDLAGGGGSTTLDVNVNPYTHSFTVGDVIRYDGEDNSDFGYVAAKADSPYTLSQAMVVSAPDSENFTLISAGYTDALGTVVDEEGSGLVSNTWYYLSDSTAGKITKVEPPLSSPVLYTFDKTVEGTSNVEEGFVFIGSGGGSRVGATLHLDEYTATVGQTEFALSEEPFLDDYITVSIDGVVQSSKAYNWNKKTLTFTSPLTGGEEIRIHTVHNLLAVPGASIMSDEYVAIAGQTDFTLTKEPITEDYLIVSIDGVIQHSDAFNIMGSILTFSESLDAGNKVRIQQIRNLNVISPADYTLSVMDIYKASNEVNRGIVLETNGLSAGPIAITDGTIVEVPDGYTWTIV